MICPSPREKEAMFTAKTQKIEDVSDHNGSTKNSQVFSSRIESYQDDDEDEEEDQPFFIKRKTEVFKQKTSQGGKFKPGREIRKSDPTSSKTSSPNALDSGVSMSANNKKLKLLPSKEASLAGPGKPSVASKLLSANIPLPSRPVSGQQVSNDSKSLVQREGSNHVMPLSCRQSQSKAGAAAGIMLIKNDLSLNKEHPNTATTDSLQRNTEASDDSDDDKPLSQRLPVKLPIKVESRHDSDDNRPVAPGRQTSGPVMRNVPGKHPLKSNAVLKKRHADNSEHPFNDTSSKKLKETSSRAESTEVMKDDEEDDIPLAHRISAGAPMKFAQKMEDEDEDEDDEDNIPLAQRISTVASMQKSTVTKKPSTTSKTTMAVKKVLEARKAKFKKGKQLASKHKKDVKVFKTAPGAGDGQKWTTLEHNGVIFPPLYKPHGVKMLYDGKPVDLTPEEEEVATMFAVMRDTDYVTKPKFLANFWNDWKKILRPGHVIKSLERCDFTPIYQWHLAEKEKKKQMRTEEKKTVKEEKLKQEEKYMWALVDGVKEKVGNFRVEPPGLFRGRGEHPKMGKLKRRIVPEDITINIGKGAPIPPCPIPGHRWKEIRHDNTVTWLAFWNDPINAREFKYVFLAASSSLKGQSDREKYEKARKLKDYITDIRKTYTKNFTSSDETTRQIAVATYLIDRLALRAGNEKDDDEADTVGCCSLKVEHVTLIPPRSLEFDFLGKDSIRYNNTVEVEAPVYKAIGDFKKSKREGQDLFDKLDTTKLNAHLKEIMPGLTAKVFRTYNASITLDTLLVNTNGQIVAEKIASYNSANKEVAVLCNHQRSVSKAHGAQMERLEGRMAELEALLEELKIDLNRAKKGKPPLKDTDGKKKRNQTPEALEKKILQTKQKIEKMKLDMKIKDDLKTVALGTSKINYLDPRITVAWCKRHEVPIEKIFNKSLLAKFAWAMDVEMEYCF